MNDDDRFRAVCARDVDVDDAFVFAVVTTGVFCRASCPARRPLRANIRFFDDAAAAAAAGFRPCKRCTPTSTSTAQAHAALVARAVAVVDAAVDDGAPTPTLAALAAAVGGSPHHLQRLFVRTLGASPRDYANARRAARASAALTATSTATATATTATAMATTTATTTTATTTASVTDALYQAGYSSSGRFYAVAKRFLGASPRAVQRGRVRGVRYTIVDTFLGRTLVAATDQGVCAVAFGDTDADVADAVDVDAVRVDDDSAFAAIVAGVVAALAKPREAAHVPLDVQGTVFQQRVWRALTEIPAGETRTYLEIAAALDAPQSVRAVARACATNTIGVLIPCHRVVRSDGTLAGYRWGVERKRALLAREAAQRTKGPHDGEV